LTWLVDVDFKCSPVHGMGVFARRPIAAGTRIWQVDPSMRFCDAAAMAALSPAQLRFALHGGYLHEPSGRFLWYTDGMQYMNHRAVPDANIGLGYWPELDKDHTIALRDIAAGEELFEDYTFWSDGGLSPDHWLYRLYRKHCPEHLAFLQTLTVSREAA
jgi:SET domain-containing protein